MSKPQTRSAAEIRAEINSLQTQDNGYQVPVFQETLDRLNAELAEATAREQGSAYEYDGTPAMQKFMQAADVRGQAPNPSQSAADASPVYDTIPEEVKAAAGFNALDSDSDVDATTNPPEPPSLQRLQTLVRRDSTNNLSANQNTGIADILSTIGYNQAVDANQLQQASRMAQVAQLSYDPLKAAAGFAAVKAAFDKPQANPNDRKREIEAEIDKQDQDNKDLPFNDFLALLKSLLGIKDEAEQKKSLEAAFNQFSFLSDENLPHNERLAQTSQALGKILGSDNATAKKPEVAEQNQPGQQSSPLSDEAKKAAEESILNKRKDFLKKAEIENTVSLKSFAINAGKAATCIGLSVALPGFGLFLSAAFLYATRNFGNNDQDLKAEREKSKRLEEEVQAGRSGFRDGFGKSRKSGLTQSALPEGVAEEKEGEEEKKSDPQTQTGKKAAEIAEQEKAELEEKKRQMEEAGNTMKRAAQDQQNAPQQPAEAINPPKQEDEIYADLDGTQRRDPDVLGEVDQKNAPEAVYTMAAEPDDLTQENLYDVGGQQMTQDQAKEEGLLQGGDNANAEDQAKKIAADLKKDVVDVEEAAGEFWHGVEGQSKESDGKGVASK